MSKTRKIFFKWSTNCLNSDKDINFCGIKADKYMIKAMNKPILK